jgi:hypothetical protein
MEDITIGLIVLQVLSFIMHTYHFKNSKCRMGKETSCCQFTADLEDTAFVKAGAKPLDYLTPLS